MASDTPMVEAPASTATITRVVLENYKSIAHCDVPLGPLTFLVGRNGSGKSNFIDAFRFISESLTSSLDAAIRRRGGIDETILRSAPPDAVLAIRLELALPNGKGGSFSLRLRSNDTTGYEIVEEECRIEDSPEGQSAYYRAASGTFQTNSQFEGPIPFARDRLFLVAASANPDFRPFYFALLLMGFYHIDPQRIRELQAPSASVLLAPDGSNLTSVLRRMSARDEPDLRRVIEYLAHILPGLRDLSVKQVDRRETVEFRVQGPGKRPLRFGAASMSDGTLRALGILAALFQSTDDLDVGDRHPFAARGRPPSLVSIEEPELALHPFATRVVFDALRDASRYTQVLVTSHSPDLMDDKDIKPDAVRVVSAERGITTIGPLDAASRKIIQEDLFTIGEMTRRMELEPDVMSADATLQVT